MITLSLFSILRRCFVAWHVLASTRVTNRRNVVLFGERRLLVMVRRKNFFMLFFHGREIYGYGYHFICGTFVSKKQVEHKGLVDVLSLWTKSFGVTIQVKALY